MTQRRLLSFFFVLLFAFAQQQALVHPYKHLANTQESASQKSSSSDEHGQAHSETCGKCISIAGIGSAIGSQAHALYIAPAAFIHTFIVAQLFFTSTYRNYQSRAPPSLFQA